MAASTTHDVTAAAILARLPFAPGNVSANSSALTTTLLEEWIDEAASHLNAALQRHGIDPEQIGGDTKSMVQTGIRAYVTARALSHRNFPAERVEAQWETWTLTRQMIREDPQSLGDDQSSTAQVRSNVDPDNPTCTGFEPGEDLF